MKVKPLSQRDWDQLLVLASGFLTLTGGNVELAMAKAIEAHARLIDSVKKGRITARLGKGTARLVVPEDGGLALQLEAVERTTPGPVPAREEAPAPARPRGPGPGVVVASIVPPPPETASPPGPAPRPPPPVEDGPTFPDVSFEVFERPSSHGSDSSSRDDATPMDAIDE